MLARVIPASAAGEEVLKEKQSKDQRILFPDSILEQMLLLLPIGSPSLRLQHITHILTKQLSIAEVSTKIATAVGRAPLGAIEGWRVLCYNNNSLPSTPNFSASSRPIPTCTVVGILLRTRAILMYSFVELARSPQVPKFAALLRPRHV